MTRFIKDGNLTSAALCLTSYFDEGKGFLQPLDKKQEKDFFSKYKAGDQKALNELVAHNMRLVVHVAKRYQGSADPEELISIGSQGLIKGINTYDPDKGIRFSTYAAKCIVNEILMFLRANKKNMNNLSIFTPIGADKEGNEVTLCDTLYDENYHVYDKIERETVKSEIARAVKSTLDARETVVIVWRYGLFGYDKKPQREIAKVLNISRSYVSRIEKKALSKLKEYLKEREITPV